MFYLITYNTTKNLVHLVTLGLGNKTQKNLQTPVPSAIPLQHTRKGGKLSAQFH